MTPRSHKQRLREFFVSVPAVCAGLCLPLLIWWSGCLADRIRPPGGSPGVVMTMEVTGYCNCGECCGWERSWFGLGPAVFSGGPNKGKPKEVGVTACGTKARHGTVAADAAVLPFGTILYVPGYGYGRVEDRGGAIKGQKLDLWFSSHDAARQWGRKLVQVRVWRP